MREANAVDVIQPPLPIQEELFTRKMHRRRYVKALTLKKTAGLGRRTLKKKEEYLSRRGGDKKGGSCTLLKRSTVQRKKENYSTPSANMASLSDNLSAFSLHAAFRGS